MGRIGLIDNYPIAIAIKDIAKRVSFFIHQEVIVALVREKQMTYFFH